MTETPIQRKSLKLLSIKCITVYFLKLIFSLKISICFVYSFNMPSARCILMSFIFGILILPVINGEYCADKFTPWNVHGGGNAIFLDRHRLNCGSRSDVLRSFKLETSGNKIRYKYTCCKLPKATCSLRKVQNYYTVEGRGNSIYLDRQHVSCGARGLLNEFLLKRMHRGMDKYTYQYYCCDFNSQSSLHCYNDATLFTNDGGGHMIYLDRQLVRCSSGYFLQSFRLNRNVDHDRLRYIIRCCEITS